MRKISIIFVFIISIALINGIEVVQALDTLNYISDYGNLKIIGDASITGLDTDGTNFYISTDNRYIVKDDSSGNIIKSLNLIQESPIDISVDSNYVYVLTISKKVIVYDKTNLITNKNFYVGSVISNPVSITSYNNKIYIIGNNSMIYRYTTDGTYDNFNKVLSPINRPIEYVVPYNNYFFAVGGWEGFNMCNQIFLYNNDFTYTNYSYKECYNLFTKDMAINENKIYLANSDGSTNSEGYYKYEIGSDYSIKPKLNRDLDPYTDNIDGCPLDYDYRLRKIGTSWDRVNTGCPDGIQNYAVWDYPIHCYDREINYGETDWQYDSYGEVSCGGECFKCNNFKYCSLNTDCASNNCTTGVYHGIYLSGKRCSQVVIPSCNNNIKDGNETDIDCGGSCNSCQNDKSCIINADCQSDNCESGVCKGIVQPSCTDNIQNNGESDVDCGGINCPKCSNGDSCLLNGDCSTNYCNNLICSQVVIPSCTDNIQNNGESDVDCGGDICPKCNLDKVCSLNNDCDSNYCDAGLCKNNPEVEPKSNWWIWLLLILVIALIGTGIYYLTRKKGKGGKSKGCKWGVAKSGSRKGKCLSQPRRRK